GSRAWGRERPWVAATASAWTSPPGASCARRGRLEGAPASGSSSAPASWTAAWRRSGRERAIGGPQLRGVAEAAGRDAARAGGRHPDAGGGDRGGGQGKGLPAALPAEAGRGAAADRNPTGA